MYENLSRVAAIMMMIVTGPLRVTALRHGGDGLAIGSLCEGHCASS